MKCSDLVTVWGMDESGWQWRPDGDYSRIPDDRSLFFFYRSLRTLLRVETVRGKR